MSSTPNEYITFLDSLSDDSFIDAINSSINIVGKTKFLTILQQGLQSTINDEKQSNDIVSELQIVAKQFAARQKKRTLVTTIGDRVKLKKHNAVGTVRFIGEVTGKKGIYYGIELDDDEVAGQMNGYFKNIQYFDCERYNGLLVKKTQILKTNWKHNKETVPVTVGDKIYCTKTKCNGIIRFIGIPYSVKKKGIYYGIELEQEKGKNNGTIKRRTYFKCKEKCGIFVEPQFVKLLLEH
eukprot:514756_1